MMPLILSNSLFYLYYFNPKIDSIHVKSTLNSIKSDPFYSAGYFLIFDFLGRN